MFHSPTATLDRVRRLPVVAGRRLPRLVPADTSPPSLLTVGTYGGKYKRGAGKGDKSYGGYADTHRAPGHFVMKIPDGLDPAVAAPMLCGGATVYSPLTQYGAGKEAKDVGVIGIGGLGHFAILFAKSLGANVTAISHSESKKEAAEKLGGKWLFCDAWWSRVPR